MADLVQTAANVGVSGTTATLSLVQAGEAITQGNSVYLKSDAKHWKSDADLTSEAAAAVGIALTPAAADEYFVLASTGKIDVGATLTVGTTYVVSGTAGAIAPIADLATGDYATILGTATAADELDLKIEATGALVP